MHHPRRFLFISTLAIFLCFASPALAVRFPGQVLRETDDRPVAEVEVSLLDGEEILETQRTDVLGMFSFDDVSEGSYTIRLRHNAYEDEDVEDVVVQDDEGERFFITPRLAVNPQDGSMPAGDVQVYAQGVTSNLPMEGASVKLELFGDDSASGTPAGTYNATLDETGNYTFSGIPHGHYRATISRPGWKTQMWPKDGGAGLIEDDFVISALLDFEDQTLGVSVEGSLLATTFYDPFARGPLENALVEVTGIDPRNGDTLVPTRALRTDSTGDVTFQELTPGHWRVDVQLLGYEPESTTVEIKPDEVASVTIDMSDTGAEFEGIVNFPAEFVDAFVTRNPNGSIDNFGAILVEIQGIEGTGTEGIYRLDNPRPVSGMQNGGVARLKGLLPGEYDVRLYNLEGDVEVPDFDILDLGNQTRGWELRSYDMRTVIRVEDGETVSHNFDVELLPVDIKGRVIAREGVTPRFRCADGFFSEDLEFNEGPLRDTNVQVELELYDENLPRSQRQKYTVSLDGSGSFSATLPAGYYSVKLLGASDYAVLDFEAESVDSEGNDRFIYTRGWPYSAPWPTQSFPLQHQGPPFAAPSGDRMDLTLKVARKRVDVRGFAQIQGEPTDALLTVDSYFYSLLYPIYYPPSLADPPQVTLGTRQASLYEESINDNCYYLDDVEAGTHTLSITHAHSTFDGDVTLTIDPWLDPGELPSANATFDNYVEPGTVVVAETFTGTSVYSGATNVLVSITSYCDFCTPAQYYQPNTDQDIQFGGGYYSFTEFTALPGVIYNGIRVPQTGGATVHVSRPGNGDVREWAALTYTSPNEVKTLYRDGPQVSFVASPPVGEDLQVVIELADAQGQPFAGQLSGFVGNDAVTFPGTFPAPQNANVQLSAPGWAVLRDEKQVTSFNPAVITQKLFVERQMIVEGTVTDSSLGNTPITDAGVIVYSDDGRKIGEGATDAMGAYSVTVPYQNVHVELRAEGYIPQRSRQAQVSPMADLTGLTHALDPLPSPTVSAYTMDRYGLFLPGVYKSGDAGGYNANNALSALTMTWEVCATPQTLSYALDGFSGQQPQMITVDDEITEVWLLDPREFEGSFFDPDQDKVTPLMLPSPATPAAMRELLRLASVGVRGGNPYRVKAFPGVRDVSTGCFKNTIDLWTLPPGPFSPKAVVFTRGGAITIQDYQVPMGAQPLLGALTNESMRAVLNTVGIVDTFGNGTSLTERGKERFPKSSWIFPLGFSSAIDVDGVQVGNETYQHLIYDYALTVTLAEGNDAPGTGLLAFGAKKLGATLQGQLGLKVDGPNCRIDYRMNGSLGAEVGKKQFIGVPAFTRKILESGVPFPISLKGEWAGSAGYEVLEAFGTQCTATSPEFGLRYTFDTLVTVGVDIDLTPFLGALGPIGPPVVTIARIIRGGVFLDLTTSTGFKIRKGFQTRSAATGSTTTGDPERANFFGSADTIESLDDRILKYGAAGKAELRALGGTASVGAGLQLGGQASEAPDTVRIFFNTMASLWPPITRVQGALSAIFDVKVSLVGVAYERRFQYDALEIDWQFGTVPTSKGSPMQAETSYTTPREKDPGIWNPEAGVLVRDFFTIGFSAQSEDGAVLAWTQTSPEAGIEIMVNLADGEGYGGPRRLAAAEGAVGLAMGRDGAGDLVIAWSEVDEENLGNPFGNTTVMVSTSSDDGVTWTTPTEVLEVDGVALDLKVTAGDRSALVTWLRPRGDMFAPSVHLEGVEITDGALGSVRTVEAKVLSGYDVVWDGSSYMTLVTMADGGQIEMLTWSDGFGEGADFPIANARSVAMAVWDDSLYAGATLAGGGTELWKLEGDVWMQVGELLAAEVAARGLALEPSGDRLAMLWMAGDDVEDGLWYAFFDGAAFDEEPRNVFADQEERLRTLSTSVRDGKVLAVTQRFARGEDLVLVSLAPGEEPGMPQSSNDAPANNITPGNNNPNNMTPGNNTTPGNNNTGNNSTPNNNAGNNTTPGNNTSPGNNVTPGNNNAGNNNSGNNGQGPGGSGGGTDEGGCGNCASASPGTPPASIPFALVLLGFAWARRRRL